MFDRWGEKCHSWTFVVPQETPRHSQAALISRMDIGNTISIEKSGSSGGSVQDLKRVDMPAQSDVASFPLFRLETQHVHQLVIPCVRDSGIHLYSDSLCWRDHPLLH